jgi:hypothetical protein
MLVGVVVADAGGICTHAIFGAFIRRRWTSPWSPTRTGSGAAILRQVAMVTGMLAAADGASIGLLLNTN